MSKTIINERDKNSVLILRYTKVIFAFKDKDLLGTVNRPQVWSSFKYQLNKFVFF